jgi:hypothetical protein
VQSDLISASTGLSTLTSITPLLRAVSADDVVPMAVVQVEAIGSLFHLNGKFADEVMTALQRHKSIRLDRIMQYVGWIRGDTASLMAGSAGGRAGAFLCLFLVEYYNEATAGEILYELSKHLLPTDRNGSSMTQLSRVAKVLSNKLGVLGFGTHLAGEVTRIREAYFNSNRPIPKTLLNSISATSMIEFLSALNQALKDEATVLFVEGCDGIGHIVALLTAFCPEDISVWVENEIVFRGPRSSVIVIIKANQPVKFGVETTLIKDGTEALSRLVATDSEFRVGDQDATKVGWFPCGSSQSHLSRKGASSNE